MKREGVQKLTMRRLAEELGMSSMITYYYVSSKEALLDLVIDHVYDTLEVPPPEFGDWDARLRQVFSDARREILKYRGLAEVVQTRPMTPKAKALADRIEDLLIEAGFDEDVVRDFTFAVWYYLLGLLAWETRAPARQRGEARQTWSKQPITLKHGRATTLDQKFESGLELLFNGLIATQAQSQAGSVTSERRLSLRT
jgi:AcrR family transcriptional regulator